jgi:hypothetical protein
MIFSNPDRVFVYFALLFQVFPGLPGIQMTLHSPVKQDMTDCTNLDDRHLKAISSVHLICGGIGAMTHLLAILQIAKTPHFNHIRQGVATSSLVLFVSWEAGIEVGCRFIFNSTKFSPTVALAWFAVDREEKILQRIASSSSSKGEQF